MHQLKSDASCMLELRRITGADLYFLIDYRIKRPGRAGMVSDNIHIACVDLIASCLICASTRKPTWNIQLVLPPARLRAEEPRSRAVPEPSWSRYFGSQL